MTFPTSSKLRDIYIYIESQCTATSVCIPDSCTHFNHHAGRDFGTSADGWFTGAQRSTGGTGGR
jgi:hypothetical protein